MSFTSVDNLTTFSWPRVQFFSWNFEKSFLILTNINWITGIEFHKLQILEICLLDNCVLYQCWKCNNIRLKPCKDIVREIFGHFENYGFKVFLRSPRAQIGPKNGEVEGRGARRRGRQVCRKVLHKCFIEYLPVIEMYRYRMVQETMFRTMMQNSHKYTSLTLFRRVSLKCNPYCEYF